MLNSYELGAIQTNKSSDFVIEHALISILNQMEKQTQLLEKIVKAVENGIK
jgi:hypothetical protein